MASINLGKYNDGVYDEDINQDSTEETDEEKTFKALVHIRGDGYVRFGLASENEESGSIKFNYNKSNNDTPGRPVEYLMYTRNFRIRADGSVYIKSDSIGGSSVPDVFVPSEGSDILIEDVEIKYDGSNPTFYFSKATTVKEVTLVLNKDHSPKDTTDGLVFNDVYSGYKVGGLETGSIYYGKLFTTVDGVTSSSDVFMVNIELSEDDIVSFADGTWSQISKMLDMHYNGIIDIADYWNIGDEKEIIIDDIEATTINNTFLPFQLTQKQKIVIIGLKHDTLSTTMANGLNKAAVTLQLKDCLNILMPMMTTTASIGAACAFSQKALPSWLNDYFVPALPTSLQNIIKTTKHALVQYNPYGWSSNNMGYVEIYRWNAFLLASGEVSDVYDSYYNASESGNVNRYPYYDTEFSRLKYTNSDSSAVDWWLRSSVCYSTKVINNVGNIDNRDPNLQLGVSPAFCI